MQNHLDLLKDILENGQDLPDRTGAGRRKVFSRQLRFDLTKGFPLTTTRQMFTGTLFKETIWFLTGSCNNKDLRDNGVSIWNQWELTQEALDKICHPDYVEIFVEKLRALNARVHSYHLRDLVFTLDNIQQTVNLPRHAFSQYLKEKAEFKKRINSVGRMYGAVWRGKDTAGNQIGRDQIAELIYNLKNDPYGSRHCVTAWDPDTAALPGLTPEENVLIGNGCLTACHCFFQCIVLPDKETGDKTLSLALNIRSSDTPVGLSYNIAQYALLTHMLAQVSGMKVGELIVNPGDAHIYFNQIDTVKIQVERKPYPLPSLWLNPEVKDIDKFTLGDMRIDNYQYHEKLVYPVNK